MTQSGRLWMRQLDQVESTAIPGTEAHIVPSSRPMDCGSASARAPNYGRFPCKGALRWCSADAPNLRGASWGTDGKIIVALDRVGGLSRVPENGGKAGTRDQYRRSERKNLSPLSAGPSERGGLFTAGNGTDPNGNLIMAQSLEAGQKRILWERPGTRGRYLASGHLVFVYQNTLYAAP